MKEYVKWIIAAVALVLVIGGASLLYNKLGNLNISSDFADSSSSDESSSESEQQTTLENTENTENIDVTDQNTEIVNNMEPSLNFVALDADGNKIEFKSLVGKPIVLNIWATWCTWCTYEMPDFNEMYQQYGDQVNFVMVNATRSDMFETVAKAKKYVSDNGFTFPVYFDTEGQAMSIYATQGYPCSFFFDETGVLVDCHIGYMDGATLESYINKIK